MSDALHDELAPVLERWTIGGAAAQLVSAEMRERLGEDPDEAELRLLAVAGPALATLVVPAPAGALSEIPDLPALPLPTIPERVRPITARVLAKAGEPLRNGLLSLIEKRGHVVHPADWLPSRTGQVPMIYAPWQDWVNGIAPAPKGVRIEWQDLGTAGRRAHLMQMRATDPMAGLDLIRTHLSGEPADVRLWMVAALSTGLNERDREFLESLSADRAPRVRTQVQRLLARLGAQVTYEEGQEDPRSQIPDFMHVETKGILRREKVIRLIRPRNQIEMRRRADMMNGLDVGTLASVLGAAEKELPALWQWGVDPPMDGLFVEMLLTTGSDAVVEALGEAICSGAKISAYGMPDDAIRLPEAALRRMAVDSLTNGMFSEQLLAQLPVAGIVDVYQVTPTWQRIVHGVADINRPAAHTEDLHALGVIVTQAAARRIIDTLVATGMPGADPRLDTLRINTAI